MPSYRITNDSGVEQVFCRPCAQLRYTPCPHDFLICRTHFPNRTNIAVARRNQYGCGAYCTRCGGLAVDHSSTHYQCEAYCPICGFAADACDECSNCVGDDGYCDNYSEDDEAQPYDETEPD